MQTSKNSVLSEEQQAVVDSNARSITVNAFAGCGKSHTLKNYALNRPREKFLLLAFNKTISKTAEKAFPANVTCETTHAIAYRAIGRAYDERNKIGQNSVSDVSKVLSIRKIEALCVLKSIEKYMTSSLREMSVTLVDDASYSRLNTSVTSKESILQLMSKLWGMMQDVSNSSIKMPHDGYLKLYTDGLMSRQLMYDCIMLDEAQDTSDAVLYALMNQQAKKIMVGDTHQSINAWRGAVNAMEKFHCDERYYLSNSYRFNESIAGVANKILSRKGEVKKLIGKGGTVQHIGTPTILCRTNAAVFDNAIKLSSMGKRIYLLGGYSAYRFNRIIDVHHLAFGNKAHCADPFIGSFDGFDEIENYAKECFDIELKQICKVVDMYGAKLPKLISCVRESVVDKQEYADVSLGTAHKSKGMEFGAVVLDEDYLDMYKYHGDDKLALSEEVNLIYVACTRAKHKLYTSRQLGNWLKCL